MLPVALIPAALKITKGAWGFVKANWRIVAVAVAVLAVVWLIDDWRDRGREITVLRVALEDAEKVRAERDQARKAVAICTEATLEYKVSSVARIARLEAALAEEPETITQYRDRIEVVDRIIQSEDCVTAITEVAEVLKGVDPP